MSGNLTHSEIWVSFSIDIIHTSNHVIQITNWCKIIHWGYTSCNPYLHVKKIVLSDIVNCPLQLIILTSYISPIGSFVALKIPMQKQIDYVYQQIRAKPLWVILIIQCTPICMSKKMSSPTLHCTLWLIILTSHFSSIYHLIVLKIYMQEQSDYVYQHIRTKLI